SPSMRAINSCRSVIWPTISSFCCSANSLVFSAFSRSAALSAICWLIASSLSCCSSTLSCSSCRLSSAKAVVPVGTVIPPANDTASSTDTVLFTNGEIFIPLPFPLHIQMFADAGGRADAAQHKAQQREAAHDHIPYILQRHQLPAEHLGKIARIFRVPAAKPIIGAADRTGSDERRDQAGSNAFNKEGKTDEPVGGAHQFHDADQFEADENRDLDC